MPADIFQSPDLFPLDIDITGGHVRLVQLSEPMYRTASFLDERVLTASPTELRMSVEEIEHAAPPRTRHPNYVFHLGHVGSTLLSRVLGCGSSVFSVREPLILRRLAGFEFELRTSFCPFPPALFNARLDTVLKLLARTYRSGHTSLIKTTSFVSEMAPLLMARAPLARAILLIARPQIHIATVLAGAASRPELPRVSGARVVRLRHRIPGFDAKVEDMSDGQLAALGWVSELLGLAEVHRRYPDRSLWVDFDEFLLHPRPALELILTHLNGAVDEAEIEVILESPDFGRYAKATDQAYDRSDRHRRINGAIVEHGDEIERGLAWISAAGNRHPEIATAARAAADGLRAAATL